MLYAVVDFCPFCVVKTIQRTDQITGNSADAFDWDCFKMAGKVNIFPVKVDIHGFYLSFRIFLLAVVDVQINFFLRKLSTGYIYCAGMVTDSCGMLMAYIMSLPDSTMESAHGSCTARVV